MEVAREKVSGPESREAGVNGGEKSARMWWWWEKRVKGKEEKKEKGNSSCGEETGRVARKNRREVVLESRCVVEPEKGGEDECGGGDAEKTSV